MTLESVALFCCLACKPAFVLQAWPAHLSDYPERRPHISETHLPLFSPAGFVGASGPGPCPGLNDEAKRLAWEAASSVPHSRGLWRISHCPTHQRPPSSPLGSPPVLDPTTPSSRERSGPELGPVTSQPGIWAHVAEKVAARAPCPLCSPLSQGLEVPPQFPRWAPCGLRLSRTADPRRPGPHHGGAQPEERALAGTAERRPAPRSLQHAPPATPARAQRRRQASRPQPTHWGAHAPRGWGPQGPFWYEVPLTQRIH